MRGKMEKESIIAGLEFMRKSYENFWGKAGLDPEETIRFHEQASNIEGHAESLRKDCIETLAAAIKYISEH